MSGQAEVSLLSRSLITHAAMQVLHSSEHRDSGSRLGWGAGFWEATRGLEGSNSQSGRNDECGIPSTQRLPLN